MITVTTVNVNGIRAAAKKGFVEWLSATSADAVCLQEVRATDEQVPAEVREVDGWNLHIASSVDKGRAGVAVLTRQDPTRTQVGWGSKEFDETGRYLEVDLPGVTVASLYLPSGETGTRRQDQKERFMEEFADYLTDLRKRSDKAKRGVVVCGDWNIAHREDDLKNWKANQKTAGFLPNERAWMTKVFDDIGYVDVQRRLHPEGPGPYSWWSYRGRAFDNDAGWRIDYHVATPRLADTAASAVIERADTHDARWSDHAPVTVVYQN
ncbi:MAG TPA: exodeoxyribonuclease III [Stackebrandtia sp.]|uniref:exodeoxyribonuclease III n=1 Tax=Stackebrandtia sp. TaxID=2023065 RepID=UPI002D45D01D|nr:exodeoxyribonuclease III [Stackebrandtia sp.]HZE39147.1 exodeoxyribonuclease III [Stackebrandtia sp.]